MSKFILLAANKKNRSYEEKAKQQHFAQESIENKIEVLRKKINQLDVQVLKLIEKRLLLARQIGQFKIKAQLPILDDQREKKILDQVSLLGKKLGVPLKLTQELFRLLFTHSRFVQQKKLGKERKNR